MCLHALQQQHSAQNHKKAVSSHVMQEISPQIVQGIVHSDQKCFKSLYDAYYSYLCAIAVSYIHDHEKARELVRLTSKFPWQGAELAKDHAEPVHEEREVQK